MGQIASRTARHGSYIANAIDVRDYVVGYYGDVNQNYRALTAFVILSAGFGDADYYNDMEAMDLLIMLADIRCGDVAALTKFLAEWQDGPMMDIRED
jgi:hypothetical protein